MHPPMLSPEPGIKPLVRVARYSKVLQGEQVTLQVVTTKYCRKRPNSLRQSLQPLWRTMFRALFRASWSVLSMSTLDTNWGHYEMLHRHCFFSSWEVQWAVGRIGRVGRVGPWLLQRWGKWGEAFEISVFLRTFSLHLSLSLFHSIFQSPLNNLV
jgi:hypothetical protein